MKTLAQAEKDGSVKKSGEYCDLYCFKVSGKRRAHVRKGKTAKDHKSGAHARRIQNQIKREAEVKTAQAKGGKR